MALTLENGLEVPLHFTSYSMEFSSHLRGIKVIVGSSGGYSLVENFLVDVGEADSLVGHIDGCSNSSHECPSKY